MNGCPHIQDTVDFGKDIRGKIYKLVSNAAKAKKFDSASDYVTNRTTITKEWRRR
jgi:hypothetical protein